MAENVLVMRGICKSFGGVPVLKNVDFTLQKGMIHALSAVTARERAR